MLHLRRENPGTSSTFRCENAPRVSRSSSSSTAATTRCTNSVRCGSLRIGRSITAEIQLEDPMISRKHAVIERHDGAVRSARRPLAQRRVRERGAHRGAAHARRPRRGPDRGLRPAVSSCRSSRNRLARSSDRATRKRGHAGYPGAVSKLGARWASRLQSSRRRADREDDNGPHARGCVPPCRPVGPGRRPRSAGEPLGLLRRSAGRVTTVADVSWGAPSQGCRRQRRAAGQPDARRGRQNWRWRERWAASSRCAAPCGTVAKTTT